MGLYTYCGNDVVDDDDDDDDDDGCCACDCCCGGCMCEGKLNCKGAVVGGKGGLNDAVVAAVAGPCPDANMGPVPGPCPCR